MMLKVE
jgi:ABC-type multidrug transport system fused ATPase/permease subunit